MPNTLAAPRFPTGWPSTQTRRLNSNTCSFWRFSYVARPLGPTTRSRSNRGWGYSRAGGPFRLVVSEGTSSFSSSRLAPEEGCKDPREEESSVFRFLGAVSSMLLMSDIARWLLRAGAEVCGGCREHFFTEGHLGIPSPGGGGGTFLPPGPFCFLDELPSRLCATQKELVV